MLNLEHWLRRFTQNGQKTIKLYGSIVTQARHPAFYTRYGIKDTMTGRYELLALHVVIVLAVLRNCEPVNGPLSRGLVEAFIADMDDNLRELGVGDTSVPKKVKKMSAGLLERSEDYMSSLRNNDFTDLTEHLIRYFELKPKGFTAQALSKYAMAAYNQLLKRPALLTEYDAIFIFPNLLSYLPKAQK